ncbi:MAG: hypothetical protein ACYSU0_17330 [Planctomycetota bacterium]
MSVFDNVFEIGMLVGFGVSWPFAVWKTWSSKRVEGKSAVFLWCIFFGYVSGILHKVFGNFDAVTALYAFNGLMVALDIALYYRYRARDARPAAA